MCKRKNESTDGSQKEACIDSESFKLDKKYEVQRQDYEMDECIARGIFASIYRIYNAYDQKAYVAKKIRMGSENTLEATILADSLNAKMKNPEHGVNIINYFGYALNKEHIYFILEYVPTGALTKFIIKGTELKKEELNHYWMQAFNIMLQILKGIDFLHELGYVHGDLKSDNILLTENLIAKICDFGLSQKIGNDLRKFVGTPLYAAPEILSMSIKDAKPIKATPSMDYFSLGILFWSMAARKEPKENIKTLEALRTARIDNMERESIKEYPLKISTMVVSLWHFDPEKRASPKKIFKALEIGDKMRNTLQNYHRSPLKLL